MTAVRNEIQAMQNPALGAVLLWRFTCGYTPESSPTGTPLPLAFLVLPLAFHARSLEKVLSTRPSSGMRMLEEKFSDRTDVLLSVQSRMLAMRMLSLRSLRIAVRTGLLTLVSKDAVLWPRSRSAPPTAEAKGVGDLLKSAEKLGVWCRDISLFEIAGLLKVEF
ncbi:MAG TPA: three component ABC system middle component [Kofleriaceae bacterium]|nr:three component ABC system middle component [Kofleriaceae bacterium]